MTIRTPTRESRPADEILAAHECREIAEEPATGTRGDTPPPARRGMVAGLVVAAVALLLGACAAQGQGAPLAVRGQTAFNINGCFGCHIVGKAGTPIGPELSHVGARYSEQYLMRWLRDPAQQRPSAHMPALELSDEDIRALAAYLASLR